MDITAATGLKPAQIGSALAAYLDGAQNWVYEGTDQHIYQAVYSGGWGW
jgi:CRISPR/Cas system-associated protein Csm6